MILTRLNETNGERAMFKSFQPPSKVNSQSNHKNNELFRSNVEINSGGGLLIMPNSFQISHKDYLNDSIQSCSSNDNDESVAEERESFKTVH